MSKFSRSYTRMIICRHNAMQGSAALMLNTTIQIQASMTTTPQAKELAYQIEHLCRKLQKELKTRVDNPKLMELHGCPTIEGNTD